MASGSGVGGSIIKGAWHVKGVGTLLLNLSAYQPLLESA